MLILPMNNAEELYDVLAHLEEYTIEYHTGAEQWYATVSHTDPTRGDWVFLVVRNARGNDAGIDDLCFERGSFPVMIGIAQRLARMCGPLVLVPSWVCLPLVITAELNIDQLLQTWDQLVIDLPSEQVLPSEWSVCPQS